MQSVVRDEIGTARSRGDPFMDRPVPPYVVYPALVIGLGVHGERVVDRLRYHLHRDDPHLLQVIRLGSLLQDDTGVRLLIADPGGEEIDEVVATETSLAAVLLEENNPVCDRLHQLCDSVAIHEQLQVLAEEGYSTFGEDDSIHIRIYVVADLSEPEISALLSPISNVLHTFLGQRGTLARTAICAEPAGGEGTDGSPTPDLDQCAFDRLYITSRIKQYGFLVASPAETETAHCLFLHTVLLSDVERVITDCAPDRLPTGTFGVATVRLGVLEMERWLSRRLALRVIRDGYLAPALSEGDGPEGRTAEVRLRTGWTEGLRDLSSNEVSVVPDSGTSLVALPHDSPLVVYCNEEIDKRIAGKPADTGFPPDLSESTIAASPLATVFASLGERSTQTQRAVEDDLNNWVRDEHLVSLPGCLEHTSNILLQWRDMLQREAMKLPPGPAESTESETASWLGGELDRIAAYLRGIGAPRFMRVLGVLAIVGAIDGGLRWYMFHGSAAVFVSSLVLLVAVALVWYPVIRFIRQRERERLVRDLIHGLERKIGAWLRTPLHAVLDDLLGWVETTEASITHARATLEAVAGPYEELGDVPTANIGSFLEQVIIDPVRCRKLYSDIPLETLFKAHELRSLVAHAIIPGASARHGACSDVAECSAPEMERKLIDGVERVASQQLWELHDMSLPDVLARNDQLPPDVSRIRLYQRTVERLRDRALPLRSFGQSGVENGDLPAPYETLAPLNQALRPSPVPIDMLGVADGETEWTSVVDEKVSAPDYLHRVHLPDARSIVYVRVIDGM